MTTEFPALSAPEVDVSQLGLPEIAPPPSLLKPLAQVRMERGFTPEFAASSLRLSATQIIAMEQASWDKLPGAAYIKGFLRSYCKFLGVDSQPYLDAYVLQAQTVTVADHAPTNAVRPVLVKPIEASALDTVLGDTPSTLASFDNGYELKVQRQRIFAIGGGIVFATLVFLAIWERGLWLPSVQEKWSQWWVTASVEAPPLELNLPEVERPVASVLTETFASLSSIPSATGEAKVAENMVDKKAELAPVVGAKNTHPDHAQINTAKTSQTKQLDLVFAYPVWVEVRDKNGQIVITGMHKANASASIKADAPLLLIIGAAHAVKAKVEGKPLDLAPHTVGNVAKVKIQ